MGLAQDDYQHNYYAEQKDVRPFHYPKEPDIYLYRTERKVRRMKNKECSPQNEGFDLYFFKLFSYNCLRNYIKISNRCHSEERSDQESDTKFRRSKARFFAPMKSIGTQNDNAQAELKTVTL